VTILATATGEESFTDIDGNGTFNAGDTFDDIGEPFRDDNEDGVRQPTEPFLDFGGGNAVQPNGSHDGPNGLFNGLLCTGAGCGAAATVAVSDLGVISMSACELDPTVFPAQITANGSLISFEFRDLRGNPLPAGTDIKFETTNGTLEGTTTFTYPNTLDPQTYTVALLADTTSDTGFMTISATCPSNVTVQVLIQVND
jgi:hypothetical protein